jgi:hypothetical protein
MRIVARFGAAGEEKIGEHVTFQRRLAIQRRASEFVLTHVAE